jgi:hypothetical protein
MLKVLERRWLTPRAAIVAIEFEGTRLLLGVSDRAIGVLVAGDAAGVAALTSLNPDLVSNPRRDR